MVPVLASFGKHLLELLLLRVVENSLNLIPSVLHDGLCFCVTILLRERCVCAKALHLLLALCHDGRKLRYLIVAETEPFA